MLTLLAQDAAVTWPVLIALVGIAMAVPSTLLVWLHVRMNSLDAGQDTISNQQRQMEKDFSDHRSSVYEHMEQRYLSREAAEAKLETVNSSLQMLSERVGDFVSITNNVLNRLTDLTERVVVQETKMQTKCQQPKPA